jgi:hypothetical protein
VVNRLSLVLAVQRGRLAAREPEGNEARQVSAVSKAHQGRQA